MTIKNHVGADLCVGPTVLGRTRGSAPTFKFSLMHKDPSCGARAGVVHTAHGTFETPVFMPVGTQGTVKSLAPDDLEVVGDLLVLDPRRPFGDCA